MKILKSFLAVLFVLVAMTACTETEVEESGNQLKENIESNLEEATDKMESELREIGEEVDEAIDTEGDAPEIIED